MSTKLKIIIGFIVFFIALLFFSFNLFVKNYTFKSKNKNSYILDCSFKKVKMIMLRANVLEQIIAAEQGKIVEKKWDKFELSSIRIFRDGIDLKGKGNFIVSKKDPYMGDILLDFYQEIDINKYSIESITKLQKPCSYIKDIKTNMQVSAKNDNETLIDYSVSVVYERTIPVTMYKDVQKKVDESVRESLNNNQKIITKIIEEHKDQDILIPIPLMN